MSMKKPHIKIRAVMFDLFETLARFWPPREDIQKEASRPFGIELTSEGIIHGYREADAFMAFENASGLPLRLRNAEETRQFFTKYEQLILKGDGFDVDCDIAEQIWENVRNIPHGLSLFDDSLPALRELHSFGLILGIISNFNMNGEDLLKLLGIDKTVQFAVTSHDTGFFKPHPPIFDAALTKAGVAAEEAIYVGDQYYSDILGARNVNINPLLIDRYSEGDQIEGVEVITTLFEVKGFVV